MSDEAWSPQIRSAIDQIIAQAVPISFMDQGPFVAAGIPALGFTSIYPDRDREKAWDTDHTPEDTMEHQSTEVLHLNGNATTMLVQQLLATPAEEVPVESGPYVALDEGRRVVRGWPLCSVFAGLATLFLLAAAISRPGGWRESLALFHGQEY